MQNFNKHSHTQREDFGPSSKHKQINIYVYTSSYKKILAF